MKWEWAATYHLIHLYSFHFPPSIINLVAATLKRKKCFSKQRKDDFLEKLPKMRYEGNT
jgi:hypothetical protein